MRSLLIISSWLIVNVAAAATWPEITDPPRATVQWVGDNITHNSVPMKIKIFASDLDVMSVFDFYRQQWSSLTIQGKPVENDLGEWKVIGYQQGDYLVTVQARTLQNKGSEGYLAVSKLPALKSKPALDNQFPRLPGTEVLSDTRSEDQGKIGKTLVFRNNHSVDSNVRYYEKAMPDQGWVESRATEPRPDSGGSMLYYQRKKDACSVVVSRSNQGGSIITVSVVNTSL